MRTTSEKMRNNYMRFMEYISKQQIPQPLSKMCINFGVGHSMVYAMHRLKYIIRSHEHGYYVWNKSGVLHPTGIDVNAVINQMRIDRERQTELRNKKKQQSQLQLESTSELKADIEAEIVDRIKHLEKISGCKYQLIKTETITKTTVIHE